jgi:hypothetical protein
MMKPETDKNLPRARMEPWIPGKIRASLPCLCEYCV